MAQQTNKQSKDCWNVDDSDEIGQIFTSQSTNVFTTGKHWTVGWISLHIFLKCHALKYSNFDTAKIT